MADESKRGIDDEYSSMQTAINMANLDSLGEQHLTPKGRLEAH